MTKVFSPLERPLRAGSDLTLVLAQGLILLWKELKTPRSTRSVSDLVNLEHAEWESESCYAGIRNR